LDGGHFLLETHGREVAAKIIDFLQANGIEGHVKVVDGGAISFGL
jgi:surfactin synthase thioesterase subunit